MEASLLSTVLPLATLLLVVQGRVQQIDITGLVGDEVRLPCEIDEAKCGAVHNIQWYRGDGDTRVFVYSELGKVDTSESMLMGRGYLEYTKGSSMTKLEIRDLQPDDESLYKCELTYLKVRDHCSVIQFVNLTTLAKPESVRILLSNGSEVGEQDSWIGPYEEDSELVLRCEAAGGKPPAALTWWNDTVNMGGDAGASLSEDGTGLGTNVIRVPLTRHDLGGNFECQATNEAMESPLRQKVNLDLYVRPRTIELNGLDGPVLEGESVTLTCKVAGARPAANVTWLRGGQQLHEQTSNTDSIQPDTTIETISRYTFNADREVNGQHIVCVASNQVIENKRESSLKAPVKLEVLYKPEVTVIPDITTVNQSTDVLLFCSFNANPSNLTDVIWYKDDRQLNVSDDDKYVGGTLDKPNLLIKNASRHDTGHYKCEVTNEIGSGMADNEALVHVQFPPDVTLTMSSYNVIESALENVTVRCQTTAASPEMVLGVRLYVGGELLRTVLNCNETDLEYEHPDSLDELDVECNEDPDVIQLQEVERKFLGNYSCSAMNSAGWGPISEPKELVIHYSPNQAKLVYQPAVVLKGSAVTLVCEVNDAGYPPASKYIWMRGNHLITDVTKNTWRINAVSLEDDANFTCAAMNQAGTSGEGSVALHVQTKPQFIERMPLYQGALLNSSSLSLHCHVECSPLCQLQWLKDDEVIEDSHYYWIETSHREPDARTNDLESVVSSLHWNMSAWPGQMLDRVNDNDNYTCRSTANQVGPGVSSTTFFTVEYPPEDVSVDPPVVDVVEGQTPAVVRCSADAYPVATYIWKYGDEVIQTGGQLHLRRGILRKRAGEYVCHAQNIHGLLQSAVLVNVMYKPECGIRQTERQGEYLLVCDVTAVPDDVTFTWRFDNETLTEHIRTHGTVSTLTVQPGRRDFGTYSCLVNNSVGAGVPCEIDVAGVSGWGMHLAGLDLVTVIAIVVPVLVLLLIIIIVVIICCRRRRAKDKLGDPNKSKPSPNGAGALDDRAVYENLPFHGMQQPPSKPLGPWSDMEYADVDYKSYGPIDYKQESQRILTQKRSDQAAAQQGVPARPPKVSAV